MLKKKSLPMILFIVIVISTIIYVLLIRPNYYRLNGGKIYFEIVYTNRFNAKDKVDFYVMNNYIYMSSVDGFKKINTKGETIWSKTYNIEEPLLLSSEKYMGIVNISGKEVLLFNQDGFLTEFKVNYPIIMANINENGFIVIVEENDKQHIIELYNQKGNLLAKRATRFEQDGYPIEVEISSNALKMVTSYLFLGENSLSSVISFFDFSDKNNVEKIIGGYTLEGTLAPEIKFLTDKKLAVVGDNILKYYTIDKVPKLIKEINIENEIKNITYTDKYIILQYGKEISPNKESNKESIAVYNKDGKKIAKFSIDEEIKNVIGTDDAYFIVTTACIRKYKGGKKIWENTIKKEIKEIIPLEKDNYLMIYQQGYDIVRVKSI